MLAQHSSLLAPPKIFPQRFLLLLVQRYGHFIATGVWVPYFKLPSAGCANGTLFKPQTDEAAYVWPESDTLCTAERLTDVTRLNAAGWRKIYYTLIYTKVIYIDQSGSFALTPGLPW